MTHSFDIEIAEEISVNAAIVYQNIVFWCTKNKANEKNFFDGNYWTYNSIKAWKELFPYLTESAIKTALQKLEEHGLILSGEYNENKYDRTRWYSVVELSKIANGVVENRQPIPDNKPDNKRNISLLDLFLLEEPTLGDNGKQVVQDFIDYRKQIKAPIKTIAPIKLYLKILRELLKLNYKINEVIELMKAKEWQSIKVEWIIKELGKKEDQKLEATRSIGGYLF